MLSCKDMYRISERLAKVMNNTEEPFGGLNMIFAGDFAQLSVSTAKNLAHRPLI